VKSTSSAIVFCALAFVLSGAAAQATSQSSQDLMQRIAGVYKQRFTSATITPGKAPGEADVPYPAEDVVEILPFDENHVYVRVHLDFYNGHTCGISGIARYEGDAFVYHDPAPPLDGYPQCAFKVGLEKGKLSITDRQTPDGLSSCSQYCGVRGSLTHSFGIDKRRTIRYVDRIKNSRQYKRAIEDLNKTEPGSARNPG
jgi:hypothetical protein